MANTKKVKPEWIIISVLVIALAITVLYFYQSSKQNIINPENINIVLDSQQVALNNYMELEKAYDIALADIEKAITETPDMSLEILRENLSGILEEIKTEKANLLSKRLNGTDSTNSIAKTEQYKEMLNVSKDVLIQRLAEAEAKTRNLEDLNKDLESNNSKLKKNLEDANKYFEKEKIKNSKLTENLSNVNEKIKDLEKNGQVAKSELQTLKREKKDFEERLKESNELLEFQNYQIKELGEILRKVNIDCYFIYEQGNVAEEAKIYLTADGISERYLKYFLRAKPNLLIDFIINGDVIAEGTEKIILSIYNQSNAEIYSIPKSISEQLFHIVIPNKNFSSGNYSVRIKAGDEDLIIGNQYKFKIGVR